LGIVSNLHRKIFGFLLYLVTFRLPYLGVIGLLRLLAGKRKMFDIWNKLPFRKLQIIISLPDYNKLLTTWEQYYPQGRLMVNEIYHKKVYDHFFTPEKGFITLDVGANIGVYTLMAAKKVGSEGKVIAVEPESENYNLLMRNVRVNKCKNTVLIKMALSSFEGKSQLYLSAFSGKHSLIAKGNKQVEVPVTTTTKLLNKLDVTKVDLMKIDTEGAELEVLKGSWEFLRAKKIFRIAIAAYHNPAELDDIRNYLRTYGYEVRSHVFVVEERKEPYIYAQVTNDSNASLR